jgi:deoxyribodipyrimidine photo-lyase
MNHTGTAIVWFRRDLRLTDNPALAAACEHARQVIALYVHAPEEDGEWAPGAASRWWLHHSLARLDAALRARGGQLTIRRGGSLEALLAVAQETDATHVYWNRLYDPARVAHDTQVKAALREAGLQCESFNAALLHEPWEVRTGQGDPYRVFTPFWKACAARLDALEAAPRAARDRGAGGPGGGPHARRTRASTAHPLGRGSARRVDTG